MYFAQFTMNWNYTTSILEAKYHKKKHQAESSRLQPTWDWGENLDWCSAMLLYMLFRCSNTITLATTVPNAAPRRRSCVFHNQNFPQIHWRIKQFHSKCKWKQSDDNNMIKTVTDTWVRMLIILAIEFSHSSKSWICRRLSQISFEKNSDSCSLIGRTDPYHKYGLDGPDVKCINGL